MYIEDLFYIEHTTFSSELVIQFLLHKYPFLTGILSPLLHGESSQGLHPDLDPGLGLGLGLDLGPGRDHPPGQGKGIDPGHVVEAGLWSTCLTSFYHNKFGCSICLSFYLWLFLIQVKVKKSWQVSFNYGFAFLWL